MSISLKNERTTPHGLVAKTLGIGSIGSDLFLGDYVIALEDFLTLIWYVFTNTDLEPNDPRVEFLNAIKEARNVTGWKPGGTRLEIPGIMFVPFKKSS